jgi:hypothetical protein
MNNQHDHMDEKDIKPPRRMPEIYHEQYELDKGVKSTQKK